MYILTMPMTTPCLCLSKGVGEITPRPITLSYFMVNMTEKLIGIHIRDKLPSQGLCTNQNAYQ